MIEYTVQDHRNAILTGFCAQPDKILLISKEWIYPVVISCIISVIACSFKDRIEIDYAYPQLLKVRKLFLDTLETPSVKIPCSNTSVLFLFICGRPVPWNDPSFRSLFMSLKSFFQLLFGIIL